MAGGSLPAMNIWEEEKNIYLGKLLYQNRNPNLKI